MFPITELQLDVLRVLWKRGEGTVVDVHDALQHDRDLARTTVATLLSRLEKRGLVSHRTEGRRHVYVPQVSERDVRHSLLDTLTDGVFGGDVTALVSHLLDARDMTPGDLARVKSLLDGMQADVEDSDAE